MTSQSVIARPYAEAAFSVAKQDNSIEEWSSDLQKIKAVCADQKITNLLLNPDSVLFRQNRNIYGSF